jgi:hypothetical protein
MSCPSGHVPEGPSPSFSPPGICEIRVHQRLRRAGDSNPDVLAHGGFQVLTRVLRLTAPIFQTEVQPVATSGVVVLSMWVGFCDKSAQFCV